MVYLVLVHLDTWYTWAAMLYLVLVHLDTWYTW